MLAKLVLLILMPVALALTSACSNDDSVEYPATSTTDANAEPAISISTLEIVAGEQGEAVLAILNVDPPGIGAWTIDVMYDANIVSIVDCPSQGGSLCDSAFAEGALRIVGASAVGLEGDVIVGRMMFRCNMAGQSRLELSIETLTDRAVDGPRILRPGIENGAIVCLE